MKEEKKEQNKETNKSSNNPKETVKPKATNKKIEVSEEMAKQLERDQNFDERGKFKKGNTISKIGAKTAGRPVGSLGFKTKFMMFLDKVAEQNEMSREEVEEQLFAVAYSQAKSGNYKFYKDIFDRVYGRPVSPFELSGLDGDPIQLEARLEAEKEYKKWQDGWIKKKNDRRIKQQTNISDTPEQTNEIGIG